MHVRVYIHMPLFVAMGLQINCKTTNLMSLFSFMSNMRLFLRNCWFKCHKTCFRNCLTTVTLLTVTFNDRTMVVHRKQAHSHNCNTTVKAEFSLGTFSWVGIPTKIKPTKICTQEDLATVIKVDYSYPRKLIPTKG